MSRLTDFAWLMVIVAILLLIGAGFALVRFYGLR